MFELISSAFKNIMRKKVRSLLTITGIGIGVLSVIVISIIGDVGKATINAELNSMGMGGLYLSTGSQSRKFLTQNELELVQKNKNVDEASPLITKVTNIIVKQKPSQAVLWGIDSNAQSIVSLDLIHGRMINKSDVNSNSRVCVVDEAFAQASYKRDNIVGKKVSLFVGNGYEDFSVIGVVKSGGNILQGMMGDVVPSFLYAPFTTLSQLSQGDGFSQIVVKLDENVDEAVAAASIVNDIDAQLGTTNSVKVENLNQQKDKLNSVLDIVTLVLSIIGGIALVVAGLSIMTVMLVTVSERTREIGIKKSIGANKHVILFEFLSEALLLSLIGSIIGCVVGVILGVGGCLAVSVPIVINIETVVFCILFSVGTGVLFGVYPALKAASLKPVDALRYE